MAKVTKFPPIDVKHNTEMYDEYIEEYRMLNGWAPGNQIYNFKTLLRLPGLVGVPLKGKDVLDVGCGTGDLVKLLRKEKINSYVGIDIYKPALTRAKKQFPDVKFVEGDLLSGIITDTFDYAFCSGALTIKLSIDNYDFLEAMVTKMWELTRIGLAFNVLSDDDPDPDKDLFFYNPEKVLQICHDIAPDAILGAEHTGHVSQIHVYMYREMAKD